MSYNYILKELLMKNYCGFEVMHFKGKKYKVLQVAEHTETGEKLVIYQALYEPFGIFARPLQMFISEVDREKYPNAKQMFRMEIISTGVKTIGKELHERKS